MNNVLWKDIFRDISKSKGRFISILLIIALGVMLFTGVKIAPIDMKATADKYYDDYNLMDLRIVSTLGLTDKDISDIKNINGILGVYGSKTIDALMNTESNEYVLRVHSISNDYDENNEDYINTLKLVEGRMPENNNECVVGSSNLKALNLKIGDKISLKSGKDNDINNFLKNSEYEIVGTVDTPYYLSNQIGSSDIGSGRINEYIFIKDSAFSMDTYTDIFVTVKGVKELNSYKKEYFEKIEAIKESIEAVANKANERRYNEIVQPIEEEINKANDEINKIKDLYGEDEALYGNLVNEIKEQINLAEDNISKIDKPKWIILDRKSHYSYVDYESAADSINKLSNVFPIFFIVVAALVCLTTMTRMVDEQRINIGTLKALGYSKWHIAKKFIIYALIASLIGSILGLVVGFTFLPKVIFDAYNIMYVLPKMKFTVDILFALAVIIVTVGLTTAVTYIACRIELVESPSVLMRPKAPKEGKRILLERVPFIWNKLNFTGKVTVRNIFRYKKRFFMTVIGIAGSTALLLAGFGIKDSIIAVVDKQFGQIDKYQLAINLNSNISNNDKVQLEAKLNEENAIDEYLTIGNNNITVTSNGCSEDVVLIIPSDNERFDHFIHLENRNTKEDISISNDGVVISEKLAKLLDVKVGDRIIVKKNDDEKEVVISQISENYINHYIYMSVDYYETIFEEAVDLNEILIKVSNEKADTISKISSQLISLNGVTGIVDNTGVKDSFNDTIKSLDLVVFIMVLCAGALSFVVLYNLTNVNISERIREIATIKVLGFYDREVASYIFRENILLSVIGLICGLGLGVVFHRFIIGTVEMSYVMFGRSIKGISFLFAALLTVLFAFLVNWLMYYKLKNVEMVESLKSVD